MIGRISAAIALLAITVSAAAQNLPQSGSDPLASEVLRALQRNGGSQTTSPQLQPNVEIQNPQVYPNQNPEMPVGSGEQFGQQSSNRLTPSALEHLMSQRAGQRIQLFGYEVFGHGGPVVVRQSGALQDNYVMGAGDEVIVTLRGQQGAIYRTRVDRDGRVVLPGIPPVAASGRTLGGFRSDVEAAVSHAFAGTQADVSIGAVRQISVRVVGEVNSPGSYSLTGLSTAMDALTLAGGIKKSGTLRDVQLVRDGRIVHLDLYALLTNHAGRPDITLTDGDRIVVPLLGKTVAVVGQVKRPAIFELPPGENQSGTLALLSLAGGPEVRGAYRFSILQTREDGRREMVQTRPEGNVPVHDGDVLFVASTADVSLAKVQLVGASGLAGYYPLGRSGSLHDLLKTAEMFAPVVGKPLPYLLIGAVIRLDPLTMQRTVVPFSPVDVVTGHGDLPLQSNDVVYIINAAEMRYIAERATATQEAASRRMINDHPDNTLPGQYGTSGAMPPSSVAVSRMQTAPLTGLPGTTMPGSGQLPQSVLQPPDAGQGQQQPGASQGTTDQFLLGQQYAMQQQSTTPQDTAAPQSEDAIANPGIIAPPERRRAENADNGDYSERDINNNNMNAYANGNEESLPGYRAEDRQLQQRQNPFARANARSKPPLRIFIGLDDDTRRLLVSSLGNYCVTVIGEVNSPGTFLAMPQTTLDKVVQAAGGVTPRVDLNAVEITSAEVDNASGTSRTIRKAYNLDSGKFVDVSLRPLDRIRFNPVYSDRDSGEVSVFGEVRHPGGYEILRGEHLSTVLARAGGFTDAAYPAGAIFLRRSVAEQERGVLQREGDALEGQLVGLLGSTAVQQHQVTDSEIQYVNQMVERLRNAGRQGGRVAVELDPKQVATHPELDLVMEPGDQLFIPRKPSSVVVAGEVMSPGGIQYRSDRSVSDYLALAGGETEIADDGHVFVIQPDGSAVQADTGWSLPFGTTKLAPGSVIVVPRTLRHFTWDTILENVIQVSSQLAITAASISVVFR